MFSYWEQQSFADYQHILIGAGIVGLSTAIELKGKYPLTAVPRHPDPLARGRHRVPGRAALPRPRALGRRGGAGGSARARRAQARRLPAGRHPAHRVALRRAGHGRGRSGETRPGRGVMSAPQASGASRKASTAAARTGDSRHVVVRGARDDGQRVPARRPVLALPAGVALAATEQLQTSTAWLGGNMSASAAANIIGTLIPRTSSRKSKSLAIDCAHLLEESREVLRPGRDPRI